MSLILDALRKSEQQRRLGETPGLVTESAWAARRWQSPAAPRRRAVWLLLPLFAVAAAGGWALWKGRAPDAASTSAGDPPTVATSVPTPAAAPASPVPAPATASAPVAQVPAAPVEPAIAAAPAPAQVPLPAPAVAPPPAAPPVTTPTAAATPSSAAPAATAPATPAEPAQPTIAAEPVAEAPSAPPEEGPAVEATPVPAPTPPAADAVTPVYALPLATRQSLPKLALTMHVYNADPARRFVILDDQRLAEGGATSDGASVVEIRRDGVVIDFRGSRFLLPRAGH